jgi:hypothetical protein
MMLLIPVGAYAAGQLVTIVGPGGSGPGTSAKVVGGKLLVGDGAGALTVNGSTRPAPPVEPWRKSGAAKASVANELVLVGPTSKPINLNSLTVAAARGLNGEVQISVLPSFPHEGELCDTTRSSEPS